MKAVYTGEEAVRIMQLPEWTAHVEASRQYFELDTNSREYAERYQQLISKAKQRLKLTARELEAAVNRELGEEQVA